MASLFGLVLDKQWVSFATSFIAVLLSASTLADKTFTHGEEMQQHRATATKLWTIRESYLSLIVDLMSSGIALQEARRARDGLQEESTEVLAEAPRTSSRAYKQAQAALKFNEDLTFSEAEIDQLLPQNLRSETGRR